MPRVIESDATLSRTPTDALVDAIAEAVAKKLGSVASGPRLLDVEGAAAYLSMTPEAIRHKVSNGKIPVVQVDSRNRFDVRDLDRWIEDNKQGVGHG